MDCVCIGCGVVRDELDLRISEQRFANGTTHLRGDCPDCGRYVKYVGRNPVTFPVGKYAGRVVAEITESDPGYCAWVVTEGAFTVRIRREISALLGLNEPTTAPNP